MGDLGGYGIAELPPTGPLFARGPYRALGQKGNPWEVVRNSISAHFTHAEITHLEFVYFRKQRRRKKARARKLQTAATTTHIAVNELQEQENLADRESTMLNKVANGTAVKTFNQWKQWLTKKSLKHQSNESGNGIQLENRNGDGGDHATALVHNQDPGPRRAILRTTVNNEQPELQVKSLNDLGLMVPKKNCIPQTLIKK